MVAVISLTGLVRLAAVHQSKAVDSEMLIKPTTAEILVSVLCKFCASSKQ